MKTLYTDGRPVYMADGFFHVLWIGKDGVKDRITSFGYEKQEDAQAHIDSIKSAWN